MTNEPLNDHNERFFQTLLVFGMTLLLGIWGLLTISSSQSEAPYPLFLAGKQLSFLFFSLILMLGIANIPFAQIRKYALIPSIAFYLLLLILPVAGVRLNSMAGWFSFCGVQFQPSELAKGFFLLDLVLLVQTRSFGAGKRFGLAALTAALWIVPIMLEPDMGTAAVYMTGFFLVVFLGGASWRILGAAFLAAAASGGVFLLSYPYAWRRITAFFNPDGDPLGGAWHMRQMELSIARGEFFGTKLGNAVWSNAYLPLPYNDSALATMIETLGLAGALPVALFFLILFGALLLLAAQTRDQTAALLIRCSAFLLICQSLIHAAVNLGLIPATGLTLPLISYGGSSMIGSAIMLGMSLSAGRAKSPLSRR